MHEKFLEEFFVLVAVADKNPVRRHGLVTLRKKD